MGRQRIYCQIIPEKGGLLIDINNWDKFAEARKISKNDSGAAYYTKDNLASYEEIFWGNIEDATHILYFKK